MKYQDWNLTQLIKEKKLASHDTREGRYILFDEDLAIKLLADGYYLVQHMNASGGGYAMWFESQEGYGTPFICGWSIKKKLEAKGAIIEKKVEYPKSFFVLSKTGGRIWTQMMRQLTKNDGMAEDLKKKKLEKVNTTLTTTRGLPPKRHDNVNHQQLKEKKPEWWPKTFAVYRTKDFKRKSGTGFAIHGVVFANGKTVIFWNSTGVVAQFDSYTQFEDVHLSGAKHGDENRVLWFDEKKAAAPIITNLLGNTDSMTVQPKSTIKKEDKKPVKITYANCFYCDGMTKIGARGRKPWRRVCKKDICRKRYLEDFATKKELEAMGETVQ